MATLNSIPERSAAEIIAIRKRHLNPTLSLSYDHPLKIVRGQGVHLYDDQGRAFLDMVNNVPHVGHCHPKVVAAGQAQMAQLNTNTRYLHDNIAEYSLQLCRHLPKELSVVFLTNSGTEANDLALRLARNYTQANDLIVLDHAYHGHSPSMIDLSPYKFNGKGGRGQAEHVQIIPMPDPYRGPYFGTDEKCGENYAAHLDQAINAIHERGEKLAAFYCESLLGCGGQIVLPPGYLKAAYAKVRAAGGLALADEVQVGFARAGEHFWAFEQQGVVPDILTIGKPIANGHPMGAVITRPEIAQAFITGMEYFNTFAGNPVSCAIALSVLDVIREEKLQENAQQVGQFIMQGLRDLQTRFPIIGDVRGTGLFIGAELITDPDSKGVPTAQAHDIIETMKSQGILLSLDGPLNNVLKIKPPIVIQRSHAEQFLDTLETTLRIVTS